MSLSRRRFLSLSGAALAYAATRRSALGCLPPPVDPTDLVAGNNAFALDLYSKLSADKGNLFLSPFSISTALAMTSAGAKGNTLTEMGRVLRLPADPHPAFGELLARLNGAGLDKNRPFELTAANALWAQQGYPWRDEFKDLTRTHYGAGLVETDFGKSEAARAAINAWVEKETKQKIKELIPAGVLDALTRLVLTNTVYFKGDWATPFDKKMTKEQPFHSGSRCPSSAPLMEQTGTFGYSEIDYLLERKSGAKAQILEMPYASRELSMLVMLPELGKLDLLESTLGSFNLNRWSKALRPQRVQVFLPRFKLEESILLDQPLRGLGIKDAFDENKADFSGMHTSHERLSISHVLHKAFVDVNEEGTEAAAATGVVVGVVSAPMDPTVFRADRPFLFLIRENRTGGILFLGRYMGPKG